MPDVFATIESSDDVTVPDLIRREAVSAGVPPELALAVADQESGHNPTALGPKLLSGEHAGEQAIGTFQILPSTAKSRGFDPHDPVQNIRGGVGYLKELLDKHQGDLNKVLAEYGGVRTNTTYVPGVLGRLSKFQQPATGQAPLSAPPAAAPPPLPTTADIQPVASHAATPPPAPSDKTAPPPAHLANPNLADVQAFGREAAHAVDPRERAGRQNWMGAGGAALGVPAAMALGVTGPFGLGTAAVLGAMLGGGGQEAVESIGGPPPENTEPTTSRVGQAMTVQGTNELLGQVGGQIVSWPLRRIVAPKIGETAKLALRTQRSAAMDQVDRAVEGLKSGLRDTLTQRKEVRSLLASHGAKRIQATQETAAARTAGVREQTRSTLHDVRARAQAVTATAQAQADRTLAEAQRTAAGLEESVRQRLSMAAPAIGRPEAGRLTEAVAQGSARETFEQLGRNVKTAAASGPDVSLAGVKEKLAQVEQELRPISQHETADDVLSKKIGARSLALMSGADKAAAAAIEETHPIHGVLGELQGAPDVIPFAEAHRIKRLLSQAVNWDSPAKKIVQQVTKGVQSSLRESMRGHAPYDAATAAYEKAYPLFEGKGSLAKQLHREATLNPEVLVKSIKGFGKTAEPTKLQALFEVLDSYASKGGGQAEGQAAKRAIQSSWTYENLIRSGPEKLLDRIGKLDQDFARTMFGDPEGAQVIQNLTHIGQTMQDVMEQGRALIDTVAEQNKVALASGRKTLQDVLFEAKQQQSRAIESVRLQGRGEVRGARFAVGQARRTAERAMRPEIAEKASAVARAQYERQGLRKPTGVEQALAASSLAKPFSESLTEADILSFVINPMSRYGIRGGIRLLHGPKFADLIQWSSFSSQRTQLLIHALTSPAPGMAIADLARGAGLIEPEAISALMSSHAATPPPAGERSRAATPPPSR